ncbi:hypothetical protein QFC22_004753 [Naganishia vaughanmartiniae]|uniref:Uncharacterized protein n=1 Tax=Naganishia vaughanmartiniae TaxID=1424756 RepID=A0ACC2WXX6_9TREE|nr:hypothetical protein QFC22_004753 [Naganishia vaughanmartiniae]
MYEVEAVLLEAQESDNEGDEGKQGDSDAEEDSEQSPISKSPLDKVHQLAIYVHASPQRKDEFETVRAAKNPETPKGLLPLKDVQTRWYSKEAAIARVIRLRKTVVAIHTRTGSKCPRFTKQDFEALEIIQPTLMVVHSPRPSEYSPAAWRRYPVACSRGD